MIPQFPDSLLGVAIISLFLALSRLGQEWAGLGTAEGQLGCFCHLLAADDAREKLEWLLPL